MSKVDGDVQKWKTLSQEEVTDCRIFTVDRVHREHPVTGRSADFFRIGTADWVNVVAITTEDELLLIRQYRHGADEITLEIPGGIVDEGESPVDTACRELLEETGYRCGSSLLIGRVRSNPALFNNWTYTVLALDCTHVGEQSLDGHEEIEVIRHPVEDIDQLVRSGAITHALVIDAFFWFRLHQMGGTV